MEEQLDLEAVILKKNSVVSFPPLSNNLERVGSGMPLSVFTFVDDLDYLLCCNESLGFLLW
jgi:hypothetical protein